MTDLYEGIRTVDEGDWLAERFEAHRPRLHAVAHRMLGSAAEADDAMQEAWLRLSRSGAEGVANLGGWLTTIVARVCLDLLRSRQSRREEPIGEHLPEPSSDTDPEQQVVLADSVGLALLVVLDTLTPAERLAFVLHDMFDVPFDQIAPVIERSPAAARQLASRARRRVRAAGPNPGRDPARQREVVTAFLAAARGGDFAALLALLDPGVMLRTDAEGVRLGAPQAILGAHDVASTFIEYAGGAQLALIGGLAGAVWAPGGRIRVAYVFTVVGGTITAINRVADRERLRELEPVILEG
jgi:RNA polymerase sigma factor (sigma-70 family)